MTFCRSPVISECDPWLKFHLSSAWYLRRKTEQCGASASPFRWTLTRSHIYKCKIRHNCLSYKCVNLFFPLSPQSMSLRNDGKSPGTALKAPSKAPATTPTKRRNSTLWSETLDVHQKSAFSAKEIKRQEVVWVNVFKMAQGNRKVNRLYLSCRQFMNCSGASRTSSRICNWHERLGKLPAN